MKHFDSIYEICADNYGIVTTGEALEVGVLKPELARYVKDGRLTRLGHGVYRLTRYIPTPLDTYAEAVALVGPNSWVHGESVLAMCNLAFASPPKVLVATRKRVRKSLPPWIEIVRAAESEASTCYEGIPTQPLADALRACQNTILPERLTDAVDEALANGLISEQEATSLRKELDPWQ